MDYHYSDLCLPNDPMMSAPYTQEYAPQYLIPSRDAEYEARSSILVDGGDRFGVSTVVFDKYEELIWMGNQGGHVTSYYGPGMQKYTSFQVHGSEEIRDIITHEEALFILTKSMLRKQIRRGLPKHTYKSPNMIDMQCLFQESPTKLLMGGHQDRLLELDITKMVETVIPIQEDGCAVLRSGGGSVVACGSASGDVTLRDVRTNSPEHTFKAHSACLSDLDMQGDLLITCGFTESVSGAVAESYVIVWDVRYLRGNKATANGTSGAWSVPIASPPLLLHFLPAFSGRAVASAGDGLVALLHVNSAQDDQSVFQVNTQNSLCTVMDVSASSQALAFGDQSGHLNLFSPQHNHEPVFNSFSRATEFAHQVELPHVSFSDTSFQFSSIPLPPLSTGGRWFNELPDSFYWTGYRKPKPIDPEVLKTMKMQGPIGYAPNPGTTRRNQMPYVEDKLEDLQAKCQEHRQVVPPIPNYYLRKDIRYIKHGPNEELDALNKTGLPGIEATLPNSYCNVMLQITLDTALGDSLFLQKVIKVEEGADRAECDHVLSLAISRLRLLAPNNQPIRVLYYTPPVKAVLLAHTCAKEYCLSCELGFLFRMMDSSSGSPCNATNFLRAFRTVPEANALGLILPDRAADPRVDLIALIQSWNRFILHQMHYEILETRKKEKGLHILANSPPKSSISSQVGNHKARSSATTPHMNGTCGEDYAYTEIEFLGPAEIDGHEEPKEDGWISRDEVPNDNEPQNHVNHDSHELNHQQSEREESEISQLFAIGRHQMNRCLKCNKEEGRESVVLACALQYPSAPREPDSRGSFIDLIRASLSSRRSTPAWCEHCGKFTPTTQRGKLVRLPPILAINCGGVTVREKAYWAKGTQKDMSESKRGACNKPCRYGLHCARPGCHFKHPDRPNSSPGGASKSPTQESNCVLPLQLVIRLQSDGDVLVNDKLDQSPSDPPTPSHRPDKHKKKHVTTQSEEEYTLSAAVVCVEDSPKHLVAYVRTAGNEAEPCWHLLNDLCIVPVSVDEVSQFGAWWKAPCVVLYSGARPRRRPGAAPAPSS